MSDTTLKLFRREGEAFQTDGPCRVEVIEIEPGRTVLNVTADNSVNIMREELLYDEVDDRQKRQRPLPGKVRD